MKELLRNNFQYFIKFKPIFNLSGKIFLNKYKFSTHPLKTFDMGWGEAVCSSSVKLPIEKIFCNLKSKSGLVKTEIENTPHFLFINNYFSGKNISKSYEDYLNQFFDIDPILKTKGFISLGENIKNDNKNVHILIKKELVIFRKKEAKIIDGLHRASILKALNVKDIKCFFIDQIKEY